MRYGTPINICAIFGAATVLVVIFRLLQSRYIIGCPNTGILVRPNISGYFANLEGVGVHAEIGSTLLLLLSFAEFF